MTLEEIENSLPNGLHDAEIRRISVDYEQRKLSFDLAVWIADVDDPPEKREAYKSARLEISGLVYLILEPPDAKYPYRISSKLRIDSLDNKPDLDVDLLESLPANAFCRRFFVSEWNSCIRFAALSAEIHWDDSGGVTYRGHREHFLPGENVDL